MTEFIWLPRTVFNEDEFFGTMCIKTENIKSVRSPNSDSATPKDISIAIVSWDNGDEDSVFFADQADAIWDWCLFNSYIHEPRTKEQYRPFLKQQMQSFKLHLTYVLKTLDYLAKHESEKYSTAGGEINFLINSLSIITTELEL